MLRGMIADQGYTRETEPSSVFTPTSPPGSFGGSVAGARDRVALALIFAIGGAVSGRIV